MTKEEILVEMINDKLGNADWTIHEWLEAHELNKCDKCNEYHNTNDLVWISAEDFEPKENEIVPNEVYQTYDALCVRCYESVIDYKMSREILMSMPEVQPTSRE